MFIPFFNVSRFRVACPTFIDVYNHSIRDAQTPARAILLFESAFSGLGVLSLAWECWNRYLKSISTHILFLLCIIWNDYCFIRYEYYIFELLRFDCHPERCRGVDFFMRG